MAKSTSFFALVALVAAVSGCARREEADTESTSEQAAQTAQSVAPEPVTPPPTITPVTIEVTLSPAAQKKLQEASESVSVEIKYAGDANAKSSAQANEFGLIELGKNTRELNGSGSITFDEDLIDKSKLGMIIGQPQVMINTTSGRKSTKENLLSCDFYWETLEVAGKSTVRIPCVLLSEKPAAN